MNHENSVSENFLGEERNFPRFGPGIDPSPPKAETLYFSISCMFFIIALNVNLSLSLNCTIEQTVPILLV